MALDSMALYPRKCLIAFHTLLVKALECLFNFNISLTFINLRFIKFYLLLSNFELNLNLTNIRSAINTNNLILKGDILFFYWFVNAFQTFSKRTDRYELIENIGESKWLLANHKEISWRNYDAPQRTKIQFITFAVVKVLLNKWDENNYLL